MKKLLFLAFMLCSSLSLIHAQEGENVKIVLVKEQNSDNYYYEGVVPVEGVSKEEMFKRAKSWVLSTIKTEDNNSNFDEQELSIFNTPTIVVKTMEGRNNDFVNFKLKLLFKDGRYKFRFDNLVVKSNAFLNLPPMAYNGTKMVPGAGAKYNKRLIEVINEALLGMSIDLENSVKKNVAPKDDW